MGPKWRQTLTFTIIDMDSWPRRKHFHFFNRFDYPHYNVCSMVDMTRMHAHLERLERSSFKIMLYCISRAANEVEALRMRIRGQEVVLHDVVHPSFTYLNRDETFSFCQVDYTPHKKTFLEHVGAAMARVQNQPTLEDEPGRDDYLFISSLPWIRYTGLTHPIHMHPVDSFPRITWCKPGPENGRITMPVSIQVHHVGDG